MRAAILGVLVSLGACDGGASPAKSNAATPRQFDAADASSPVGTMATPIGVSTPTPTPDVEPPPVLASPAVEATLEAREAAVLAVLSGEKEATRYPLVDVDPGSEFDPGLRDVVAPRMPIRNTNPLRTPMPTVTGGLERDLVRRIVRHNINQVRFCYEQRAPEGKLTGDVSVAIKVQPDGSVASAEVDSNSLAGADGRAIATCIATATKRWMFPAMATPSDITLPFSFTKP